MIEFTHVTKRYEGSHEDIFQDFNLEIKPGEFILLTGESGAGKSTFIRLLLKDTTLDRSARESCRFTEGK